jgi:hypothetical protein
MSSLGCKCRVLAASAFAVMVGRAGVARADFDEVGNYVPDEDAIAFESFDMPTRYVPADADASCQVPHFEEVSDETAVEGGAFVRVKVTQQCPERFQLDVPEERASYRATVWIRHGSANARLEVAYPDAAGRPNIAARMAPTGRATSDGWIELASNDFSVDGTLMPTVSLRFGDFASADGVDVDALELRASGAYREETACEGVRDPICGDDALCVGGRCIVGELGVPPLPDEAIRDAVVDSLEDKLEVFFGGHKTRTEDLPRALASLESMREATTAYEFWGRWGRGIRELHDWHTSASAPVESGGTPVRLNACFIEGDADLSHGVWPRHPVYRDILVSHSGTGAAGLHAGDRLVAVDGQHPIDWARGLVDVTWGYHIACDSASFADLAEELGGPTWAGGALIVKYAKTISVIRCDASTGVCADTVETIRVKDLPQESGGPDVACDNRPTYHLGASSPDPSTHYVFSDIHTGPVDDTTPDEAIYGMVWDTLYGAGVQTSGVNKTILDSIAFWKANARGVILDHRAGNGGTLDSPENMTKLVRPKEVFAAVRMPIEVGGYAGPFSVDEGLALFDASKTEVPYTVGDADYAPDLPVALIIHRDGSASDYLPAGMKGAPKTKLFGPGPTAGAFSTFIQFSYWGGVSLQFASGDTIRSDGVAMLGKGVMPDFVIQQKQSDLLVGKDTIHEAALAWVRQELKP